MKPGIERRRTIRLRRSALTKSKLEDLDRPALKCAETIDELEQAFKIVYRTYRDSNYIPPNTDKMYYNHYCLLPTSNVFIFKEYLDVVSTLSSFGDNKEFGLPMDSLYKDELDELRKNGRRLVEMGMLATPKKKRMNNLVIYLVKVAINYAIMTRFDHICAMINPKHLRFYTDVLMFDQYGDEKWYDAVSAPAIAVGADMNTYMERIKKAYGENDFETNLHTFFTEVFDVKLDPSLEDPNSNKIYLDQKTLDHFIEKRPDMMQSLSDKQKLALRNQSRIDYLN